MITLVKFIRNKQKEDKNRFVTRTLGKVGVIHSGIYDAMEEKPRNDEFWYVEILDEVGKGLSTGCFILRPLKRVPTVTKFGRNVPDIVRLIPGTYDTEKIGNTIYVYPRQDIARDLSGPHWILDVSTKTHLINLHKEKTSSVEENPETKYNINSMIVVFDEPFIVKAKIKKDDPILDIEDVDEDENLDFGED